MKRVVSGIMLTLLLIGMLTFAFDIQPAKASGTICIRADGSVDGTTNISTADNVTYILNGTSVRYQLIEKWSTTNDLRTPESVIFDDARNILYVSNINGSPLEKNGNGFISKVSVSGEIETLEWITELNAPKGMATWQNILYVSDIDELVEIDIETGTILNRYQAENAVFLNDVAVDGSGNVYVSDMSSQNSVIYIFTDGILEVWLRSEQISRPNGLFNENGKIIVGTDDGYLKAIDLLDKSITTIAETGFGIDGVQGINGGNFLVSDWNGKIAIVSSTGEVTELLNTAGSNINSADIEYIPEDRLLLIPTFHDNRVVAYELRARIYIKADGSIEGTDKIEQDGNLYTFIDNIYDEIVVERSNITIDGAGHTVNGSGTGEGFALTNINNVTIKNLTIKRFHRGIQLSGSSSNTISGNNIIANNDDGIQLHESSGNTISGNNIIANNGDGIQLSRSSNYNTISGNNVTTSNRDGIFLYESSSNCISGNIITKNNYDGIYLCESSNYNTISGNNIIANNWNGVELDYSSSNSIHENNITDSEIAIWLREWTNYNTILRNNMANNDCGIDIEDGQHTIYHNNFIGNNKHVSALVFSTSTWDSGVEGNYWSNCTSVDLNHDGIGDTSHILNAYNEDNYPLMGPFHGFNTSLGKPVNVISNSTVEGFEYESPNTIRFSVSNVTANQTHGFCRISIPYEVMSEPFNVTIDGANPTYWNYTLYDDGKNRWIYFEYEHTTREIVIVPEFPSFLILPLFMITTLLAVAILKKDVLTRDMRAISQLFEFQARILYVTIIVSAPPQLCGTRVFAQRIF